MTSNRSHQLPEGPKIELTLDSRKPHQTDYIMAGRAASLVANTDIHRVNTAADLARLRDEGKHLNPQELKELKAT